MNSSCVQLVIKLLSIMASQLTQQHDFATYLQREKARNFDLHKCNVPGCLEIIHDTEIVLPIKKVDGIDCSVSLCFSCRASKISIKITGVISFMNDFKPILYYKILYEKRFRKAEQQDYVEVVCETQDILSRLKFHNPVSMFMISIPTIVPYDTIRELFTASNTELKPRNDGECVVCAVTCITKVPYCSHPLCYNCLVTIKETDFCEYCSSTDDDECDNSCHDCNTQMLRLRTECCKKKCPSCNVTIVSINRDLGL